MSSISSDRKLFLQVSGPIAKSGRADAEAATALLRELLSGTGITVTRAETTPTQAPGAPDPKADPTPAEEQHVHKGGETISLAELAITGAFSASTLAALTQIVIAFVRRGAARRIVLRDGARTLTIVDPSERTERAVARWLAGPDPEQPAEAPALPDQPAGTVTVPDRIAVPEPTVATEAAGAPETIAGPRTAHARRGVGSGVD
ncbi:hypothetical protein BDK92_4782 [Micromonospora pisi]|uniref:Uncharacterized protein n=1 Tax=Micromonospora pisi TaxID=589240 RepID=A0A495JMY1_9ACTN|nr:hypothetical protein [Micromonospora pisi]RKR90410.1 hypothetical protein BDK92_4782 [Micromonospora pisi]